MTINLKTHDAITKRTNQYFAEPTKIVRKQGWNKRFDFGDVDELASSIKQQKVLDGHGLLFDLHVKALDNGTFELVDGDRRLTAIELLIKQGEVWESGVPVKVVPKDATDVDLRVRMMAANTSKPFLPLEEAAAYKELRDAGMTLKAICAAVGRKSVHVNATLALLDGDDELKTALANGKVTKTQAKEIATAVRGDKTKQKELVQQTVAAGGDRVKKQAAKAAVHAARTEKAKKQGKTLKEHALPHNQLEALEATVLEELGRLLDVNQLDLHTDLDKYMIECRCAADGEIAYTYGLLVALRAAMGTPGPVLL